MLAFRNPRVIDRSAAATSRRMYGCLYGMSGQGSAALPVIPLSVALLSALQAVVFAVPLPFARTSGAARREEQCACRQRVILGFMTRIQPSTSMKHAAQSQRSSVLKTASSGRARG